MCVYNCVCSHRYRENGNPDTAGMVIEKAAKSVPHSVTMESLVVIIFTTGLWNIQRPRRLPSCILRWLVYMM